MEILRAEDGGKTKPIQSQYKAGPELVEWGDYYACSAVNPAGTSWQLPEIGTVKKKVLPLPNRTPLSFVRFPFMLLHTIAGEH